MISIEEMRKELEAAGYEFYESHNPIRHNTYVASTSGWKFESVWLDYTQVDELGSFGLVEVIQAAWGHYQREKQFEKLEVRNRLLNAALNKLFAISYELLSFCDENAWPASVPNLRKELLELQAHSESYRED